MWSLLAESLRASSVPAMDTRVIAIDWSGDITGGRGKIWLAEVRAGTLVGLEGRWDRAGVIEHLISTAAREPQIVVGLDFAFSLPAWFLAERGLASAPELWDLVDREGESWLRECAPPFWGRAGRRRPVLAEHHRRTEYEVGSVSGTRAKSVFQIGGAGAVGTGSVRGMPFLARLRKAGFSIWPFDRPAHPLVVEIYPRLLTGAVVKSSRVERVAYLERNYPEIQPDLVRDAVACEDAFDAAVSALVMAAHIDELQALQQAIEPVALLEGAIWVPHARRVNSSTARAPTVPGARDTSGRNADASSGCLGIRRQPCLGRAVFAIGSNQLRRVVCDRECRGAGIP